METDLGKVSQRLEESEQKGEENMVSLKIAPQYEPLMQDFEMDDEAK